MFDFPQELWWISTLNKNTTLKSVTKSGYVRKPYPTFCRRKSFLKSLSTSFWHGLPWNSPSLSSEILFSVKSRFCKYFRGTRASLGMLEMWFLPRFRRNKSLESNFKPENWKKGSQSHQRKLDWICGTCFVKKKNPTKKTYFQGLPWNYILLFWKWAAVFFHEHQFPKCIVISF